jgi:hypothetical protein
MSDDSNKKVEQASELLFDQVYVPAFLKQCKAEGIDFSDPAELRMALQSTLILKSAEAEQNAKVNGSLHKTANLKLREMVGEDVAATEKEAADAEQSAGLRDELGGNEAVQKAAALIASLAKAPE